MNTPEHIASRPNWSCRQCGLAWPCEQARRSIRAELDDVSLAIFMWVTLEEAAHDMCSAAPAALFERFIAWTGPVRSAPVGAVRQDGG